MKNRPKNLLVGATIVACFVVVGVMSVFWTPYDPTDVDIPNAYLAPTWEHPFGTDSYGHDLLSVVMAGTWTSLKLSFAGTITGVVIGALIGLAAAAAGPWPQTIVSRIVDVGIGLPGILIALVIAVVIGPGIMAAIISLMAWFVPVVARLVIGPARQILALEYVEAAVAYGRSRWFISLRHVLPNVSSVIIVQASLMFALGILTGAALAFLGIGVQAPTPSWGRSLTEAQGAIQIAPHLIVFPGLAIMLAVLGFNLLGDGLRSTLEPGQRKPGGGS